ncbi:Autophagy protein 22 [Puccinia graminis f. sp. tritici]|uniref:Autophagy protein 22 n=1 Tax=Puccinia graminis f. sp. tritici TaxID=56615 RepID=A0A5B0RC38_PUCGR|nr:Autophagy protein 22 [Puccinia graminis f. sp. tritici]
MLKEYKQLKNTIRFLMAWFFLSDEMTSSHLILIGVIVPTTGIVGALVAPRIQQKLQYCSGLNGSLKMFKLLIGFSCLVPGYVSITLVFGIPVPNYRGRNVSSWPASWSVYAE